MHLLGDLFGYFIHCYGQNLFYDTYLLIASMFSFETAILCIIELWGRMEVVTVLESKTISSGVVSKVGNILLGKG